MKRRGQREWTNFTNETTYSKTGPRVCVCVPEGGVCVYAGHVWIPPGSTSRESKRGPTRAAGEELALL